MDYEFSYDEYMQPVAKFSAGHEAIGRWFSEALSSCSQGIEEQLAIISQFEQRRLFQYQVLGSEFQLRIIHDEVEVIALTLDSDTGDELPEDTSLYSEELYAECGLQDFKQALQSWQAFISDSHT